MGWGGAASGMNQSLKDNRNLKGERPSYFKNRKKDKTIYKKQTDKNAGKMSPEEFNSFSLKLKKEKRRKTIINVIMISIFIILTVIGFFYIEVF